MKDKRSPQDQLTIKHATFFNEKILSQIQFYDRILKFVEKERELYTFYNNFDVKLLDYMEICAREARTFMRENYKNFKSTIDAYQNDGLKPKSFDGIEYGSAFCYKLNEATLCKLSTVKDAYAKNSTTGYTDREKLRKSLDKYIKEETKIQEILQDDLFDYRQKEMLTQLFDDNSQNVSAFFIGSENLTQYAK